MARPDITGVWHGLYSYPVHADPVYFIATLISFGQGFSGTTHEAAEGRNGAVLTHFASVDGQVDGTVVSFVKTYSGHLDHSVTYEGTLSADGSEVEGQWMIPGDWSGRFLMIRGQNTSEGVVRQVFEKV